jgi:pantothenate kinase type III
MTSTAALLDRIENLEAALYAALPFVEDHEDSHAYKAGAVAATVALIRKVLKEPKQ